MHIKTTVLPPTETEPKRVRARDASGRAALTTQFNQATDDAELECASRLARAYGHVGGVAEVGRERGWRIWRVIN